MSAFVKRILAGEPVTGRHRYGQTFEMRCQAFHLFATNELPKVQDKSGAIARRALIVGFKRSLTDDEVDPALLEKVGQELPGVVAWAVKGFERAMRAGRFTIPHGQHEAMVHMQHHGDGVAIFAHLHLMSAPGARLHTAELKKALRAFAMDRGFDPMTIASDGSMRRIAGMIEALHGGRRSSTNNNPYYEGVKLKLEAATPLPEASDEPGDFEGL